MVKLIPRNNSISILICPIDHILNILIIQILSDFKSNSSQIFNAYESCSFSIEQSKDMIYILLVIVLKKTRSHQMDELLKCDITSSFTIKVQNDLIDGLVSSFRTQWW